MRLSLTICLLMAVLPVAALSSARAAESEEADPAELAKQYGSLPRRTFYRHASHVFDHLTRFAQTDESRISPQDRFIRAFYEGRWDEIRQTLERLPEPLNANVYNKMLTDLTGRYVPILTLDDFLGLADACPGELTSEQVRKLGLVLRVAVAKDQELWLKRAVEKGTRRLGSDAKRRLVTGRILLNADFDELARGYLPTFDEAGRLDDLEVREEVVKFLASQEDLEQFQQTQVADLWKEHVSTLDDPGSDSSKRQKAVDSLADLLGRAPAPVVRPWILSLARQNPEAVLRLATSFGKRSQTKINDQNIELRANNLEAQKCLLECVSQTADLSKPPWNQMALMLADWWIHEAENTFEDRPAQQAAPANRKSRYPHVAPADLLESSPDGAWAEALAASLHLSSLMLPGPAPPAENPQNPPSLPHLHRISPKT